jgi:hypothetical protein
MGHAWSAAAARIDSYVRSDIAYGIKRRLAPCVNTVQPAHRNAGQKVFRYAAVRAFSRCWLAGRADVTYFSPKETNEIAQRPTMSPPA